ncbi:P-loop containing nucleoside triphosphate hydrolase protein [Lipomyces japonicus]|uniref:P-loop containing nucleoside triphosphate hydrolase protein n=1 Tax=Lipomyces japonicus TaxID=56871 RepID=UPI0034CD8A9B
MSVLVEQVHRPITVHIEVQVKSDEHVRFSQVKREMHKFVIENFAALRVNSTIDHLTCGDASIDRKIEKISVVEVQCSGSIPDIVMLNAQTKLEFHVYQLSEPDPNEFAPDVDEEHKISIDDEHSTAAVITELPHRSLEGLWESLVFDEDIKHRLLHFMSTMMLFSDHKINYRIVTMNRMILLHGPPGTGKTSLCRSLAQKLTIRMTNKFVEGKLVEISAHSLFSKWFSESGKLVGKLFEQIRKLLSTKNCFVCVLIDEVESLTASRKAAACGSEPSDGLRVVNALLTELDRLRDYKNVLIMTTSNLLQAMDPAFLERVDVKQYVGWPSAAATYEILRSCVIELIRCGLVFVKEPVMGDNGSTIQSYGSLDLIQPVNDSLLATPIIEQAESVFPHYTQASLNLYSKPNSHSSRLLNISHNCKDFGGRTLRRLAVLGYATYIHCDSCELSELLHAFELTVKDELQVQLALKMEVALQPITT